MIEAVNWDKTTSEFASLFWEQNTKQFWLDTEIPVSKDRQSWSSLTDSERDSYMKVLGGLTLLDTTQGGVGMPYIAMQVDDLQDKAVLTFMAAMEQIHAKSYSTIFTTLANKKEIEDTFKWVKNNKWLQNKTSMIEKYYRNINDNFTLAKAMIASVFLESYLFYSGFYYPLLLAGQGKMRNSGEIIKLIVRDESIHGVFVGLLYQRILQNMNDNQKNELYDFTISFMLDLYNNECKYTEEIYDPVGLTSDVKKYVRYNANKALMNLGYDQYFPTEEVNQIVLNGLNTGTGTFDFFSQKGSNYVKIKVVPLQDEDFDYINELASKDRLSLINQ